MLQQTMIIALMLSLAGIVGKDLYKNYEANKERCITVEDDCEEDDKEEE